jgi:Mor family transcriptional regulator
LCGLFYALEITSMFAYCSLMNTPPQSSITETARKKWPELLVQLLDCARATALRMGLAEEQAEQFAYELIRDQANQIGGMQIYIPKGEVLDRAIRDREIYQQAGRTSPEELAQRYKLSMKQIWEIQRTQRQLHIKQTQGSLF